MQGLHSLRKVVSVIDLIGLMILMIGMIFLGNMPSVFIVFGLCLLSFILVLYKINYASTSRMTLKFLVSVFLGFGVGLLQLSPIPTLAIILISIFTVISLPPINQISFGVVFFISSICSYFFGAELLGLSRAENTLLNVLSVFALFFTMSARYYYVDHKYHAVFESLRNSRVRFNHFVNVSNRLARYTPSQVWRQIVQEDKEVKLENKRRKLTVFFSDIKGFTDLSESLSAEDLTNFLNAYFEAMALVAKKHGGTVDKFIGDAIMVFFGDPDSKGEREDALACVEMAVDMRREISRLRTHWRALGFEGLDVRMGINTGYCHVGNFGSPSRLSYTAIGREVNLSARIQSVAQPNEILISQNTYELIQHNYRCTKGMPVMLKGIEHPVQVWSVDAIRQGQDLQQVRWIEHDLPGFNLHLNMKNIQAVDKVKIRQMLREAAITIDERIRTED